MAGTTSEDLERVNVTFGVVVGTFGSQEWCDRGDALVDNIGYMCDDIIHAHGETLAQARNLGLEMLDTDWVVFLDADDNLSGNYIKEMKAAHEPGHLLQPATIGNVNGKLDDYPVLIQRADFMRSNYLIIGTAVERSMVQDVGGFRELDALEDWDLWIRCILAGSSVKRVPAAVYIVGVHEGSRNRNRNQHILAYREITNQYGAHADILRNHTLV